MRRPLTITACVLFVLSAARADSERPSPFGPRPNGRTYEKVHQRTVPPSPKNERPAIPEQQRARSAEPPDSSSLVPSGQGESGTATYSGNELDGRPTASGEIFDSNALTAAHPSLPIGSYVRVTNVSTGKSVVVRINDRCRASANRVIQVTKRAADDLGLIGGAGNATVRIEPLAAATHGAE